jgi:hypothetical protein
MSRTDDLKFALLPWMSDDLNGFANAIGAIMEEVTSYADDGEDGTPGWVTLFDPDRCPAKGLPFLAQWYGERLPTGLSEAQQREWIKDNPNSRRGTIESIFLAAQRKLTGSRTVSWQERLDPGSGPNPEDHLVVHTYTPETPDPAGTLTDILSVSPADIQVHYSVLNGESWADITTAGLTWAGVAAIGTWAEVATQIVGVNSYSRPAP